MNNDIWINKILGDQYLSPCAKALAKVVVERCLAGGGKYAVFFDVEIAAVMNTNTSNVRSARHELMSGGYLSELAGHTGRPNYCLKFPVSAPAEENTEAA